eukprot:5879968-Alexandrium_andersonii.AAC.1
MCIRDRRLPTDGMRLARPGLARSQRGSPCPPISLASVGACRGASSTWRSASTQALTPNAARSCLDTA